MKIRTRLMLWYATTFSLSLLVIGWLMYEDLVLEPRAKLQHRQAATVDADAGEDVTQIILIYGGAAIVVGLAGGWWLMRRAMAPVTALTRAAGRIHDGNLHEQIPRTGNGDELDQLTEVFNAMTARLDGSFNRIREFTLHASHELKTPLTVLHGAIETASGEKSLSTAQRERLASQLDEIQRLAKIVDGLTLLTKADAGQVALKCELLHLEELVREVFEDTQILARPQNISVSLETSDPVLVRGDKHRLRQLLLNLADNAVKYNRSGGFVKFSLRRDGTEGVLTIANSGDGIAPELLPRVFERFFRGDAAHSSALDGCGLGLSIAQWIATAHKGSMKIESAPHDITTATVRIPTSDQ